MSCYYPIPLYLHKGKEGDKYSIVKQKSLKELSHLFYQSCDLVYVPCGKCVGCKLDKSREWAIRCMDEASLYEQNCFITLTYDDDHVPPDYSLHKRDLQLFFKRLRKYLKCDKVRYFACGEYGTDGLRPHYHAILFGWCPPDCQSLFKSTSGHIVYKSAILDGIWQNGLTSVGACSVESAGYVARYGLKQIGDKYDRKHWTASTFDDNCVSPFLIMSRRPGIGKMALSSLASELAAHGRRWNKGKWYKIPRFYKDKLADTPYADTLKSTLDRVRESLSDSDDYALDYDRGRDRELCKLEKIKRLKRQ